MEQTADSTSSIRTGEAGSGSDPAAVPDAVLLGRIVGAHGLRGELRVSASGDDLLNLQSVARVRLVRDEGDESSTEYEVVRARSGRTGEIRLVLRGVDDRDAAEALRGRALLARSADLPPLEPGVFYAYELVGCAVEELDGRAVGTVCSILQTGGRDVLVIEGGGGRQQLVPAVEPFLTRVDVAARRIVIDPPPGLLEPDEAGVDTGEPEQES